MPRTMLNTSVPTLGSARWAGDYFDRDHMVPGGATVASADFAGGFTNAAGKIVIPSGTIIGRTRAERDAGTGFGPAADTDEEIYLTCFDINDAASVGDVELYRYNSVVYENFLPAFAGASATLKTFLRNRYVCSIGQV